MKKFYALLLLLPLMVFTGCAGSARPVNAPAVTPMDRTAEILNDIAAAVSAGQQEEITLHKQALIDTATHQQIQFVFEQIGTNGSLLTQLVNSGASQATISEKVNQITALVNNNLPATLVGIKDPQTRQQLTTTVSSLTTLAAQLLNALSTTYVGR